MGNATEEHAPHTALVVLSLLVLAGCATEVVDPPPPSGNQAPVAMAGTDQAVSVGLAVGLDGSASSDADSDPLTYAWTLTAPNGSAATLDDATSVTPMFTPDVAGTYGVSLVVNDGTDDSPTDAAVLTAADNTETATVGGAGGDVTSSDGILTLAIPAGALAADTEISITRVGPAQFPEELRALAAEALVYDLQPDGLTFGSPVAATFSVPDAVSTNGDEFSVHVGAIGLLSGGQVTAADNQTVAVTKGDDVATVRGTLTHFSFIIAEPAGALVLTDVPASVPTAVPFLVSVGALPDLGSEFLDVGQSDFSLLPVMPEAGFSGEFEPPPPSFSSRNSYVCGPPAGPGRYETRVVLRYIRDIFFAPNTVIVIEVILRAPVECEFLVAIEPVASDVVVGEQVQFRAFTDNGTREITSEVAWSSGNTSVATMQSSGLATAVGPGTATIRAAFDNGGVSVLGTAQLTVADAPTEESVDFGAVTTDDRAALIAHYFPSHTTTFGPATDIGPRLRVGAGDGATAYFAADGPDGSSGITVHRATANGSLQPTGSLDIGPTGEPGDERAFAIEAQSDVVLVGTFSGVHAVHGPTLQLFPSPVTEVVNQPLLATAPVTGSDAFIAAILSGVGPATLVLFALEVQGTALLADALAGSPLDLGIDGAMILAAVPFASNLVCMFASDNAGNVAGAIVTPMNATAAGVFDVGGMGVRFHNGLAVLRGDASGRTSVDVYELNSSCVPTFKETVVLDVFNGVATAHDNALLVHTRAGDPSAPVVQTLLWNPDGTVTVSEAESLLPYEIRALFGID